ncbi:MAG: Transcriptional regulator, Xre family [uncultured Sphingomonas sp.]|uniref:Transcriptional regulator, Xre family n=1 Tax=uncultured Sphingomonas sp. TaxID=158754 RepID=A0A6J4S8M2_9SPHN|nr:short-chain fatty acyl-CoA regulator family protein [uncultured Sphingomonas sp.]CAA9487412.1 MAG: Transcriptional regulator, Xre family [uncultured Sphingomonas sp.]
MAQRKLFLGARLKRLRRERSLQQAAMAGELGISASYLNHLERNQRPVTAGILLRLAETFDVDIKQFAAEGSDGGGAEQLLEVFSDGMFADLGISRHEIMELADNAPALADGLTRLYTAFRELQRHPPDAATGGADPRVLITPETWVRDYIQSQRNHWPELEEGAETLGGALGDPLSVAEPLRRRLKEAFGVDVRLVPPETLEQASQMYDPQRRLLLLSSLLRPENRTFGIAYQLSLLEFHPTIVRMLEAARPPDPGSRRLLHMSFANYAAGAIMMPYGKFLLAAEEHRYAIDRLCGDFGANVEQVAHRLTTLGRQGARGVPFFMLRVDPAGNISKRYAGENFPFSHFGGTCPRWHLHAAFQTPGQTIRQLIETPDGQRYFTISRTIERPIRPDLRDDSLLAIGLGCDVRYAGRIAYSDGLDLVNTPATPVGPACSICPRLQCPYRATPPAGRALAVHENRKSISPYPFVPS